MSNKDVQLVYRCDLCGSPNVVDEDGGIMICDRTACMTARIYITTRMNQRQLFEYTLDRRRHSWSPGLFEEYVEIYDIVQSKIDGGCSGTR